MGNSRRRSTPSRVTLAQVEVRLGELDANVETAARAIEHARADDSDVILFPELALSGYSDAGNPESPAAIDVDDPRLRSLAGLAGGAGVLIGFAERTGGAHAYNSAAFFENGALIHLQRKVHLPDYGVFDEGRRFLRGDSLRSYDTRHGRVATLICNDAWHPELSFLAVSDGAQLILVPSNSAESAMPEAYQAQEYWREITRFTARMFETYVVFINRVGTEGELRFWGRSHVVDPWGSVVAEAPPDEECVLTTEIDLAAVERRRQELPLLSETRLDLMQSEIGRLIRARGTE